MDMVELRLRNEINKLKKSLGYPNVHPALRRSLERKLRAAEQKLREYWRKKMKIPPQRNQPPGITWTIPDSIFTEGGGLIPPGIKPARPDSIRDPGAILRPLGVYRGPNPLAPRLPGIKPAKPDSMLAPDVPIKRAGTYRGPGDYRFGLPNTGK